MEGDLRFQDSAPIETPGSVIPAVLAGIVAAVVAGAAWAAIVWLTNYEIGFAAIGVGGFVGFAMSRATSRRDRSIGVMAAVLALVGLLAARVFIAEFVMPNQSVGEVLEDSELMNQAAMIELGTTSRFSDELQARYDSVPAGENIPEDLLRELKVEAQDYLGGVDDTERQRLAQNLAALMFADMGLINLVTLQMGPFDILWVFLAVSTAWKMMSREVTAPLNDPQQTAP
jgi:hypothetical protein